MARFILITIKLAALKFATLFHDNIELKYRSFKGIVFNRDSKITSKF
jgi:hypothetical protein